MAVDSIPTTDVPGKCTMSPKTLQQAKPRTGTGQTSDYYYLFNQYYAARAMRELGSEGGGELGRDIRLGLIQFQQKDRSWVDTRYESKAYGTAMAVLTLHNLNSEAR